MSISQGRSGTLLGFDQPERVEALRTSSSLFHLLGATPLHGRLLLPEEDTPGKPPVVILSHGFWRRVFNAEPNVIGRSITMNGVVGIGGAQKPVHDRRRARSGFSAERRDHADGRQHQADGHLPAAAARRRCRHSTGRRELQHHGAPQAGCDDGRRAGRCERDCRQDSRQGQARPDVHDQRRSDSSRSSATCDAQCSCSSDRSRSCC